jgi:hypothetical protein
MKRRRPKDLEPWEFIAGYFVCCGAVFDFLILLRFLHLI